MLKLTGKPCDVCGCLEYIQQEKNRVICSCCRSLYTEMGELTLVGVDAYNRLLDRLEEK